MKGRERRPQADTQSSGTAQENGQRWKGDRGTHRSTVESHQRNMDGVSARGRSVTGAEKIREETWYTYAAGGRRTSGDPRSHHGKSAGRFWDTGEIVDAGTDEAIHSKAVP